MAPFVLPRLVELGILGICLPVRYGGQGLDYLALGLACEELEAVDTTLRVVLSVHIGLNSLGLFQWASEEQKRRFLVPQARGERIACFGLTESGAGSDVAAMTSTARRSGGDYLLNGEKMWISLATKAHHALVVARTDLQAADPHDGLSAFLVELDSPGVTRGDLHGKLGVRAGSTGWLAFNDVRLPVENRIGEEGEGFKIAMACLDNGRFTVAAGATGLIRACLEASVKYAHERQAFGREIGRFQLVQQKIANMVQSYDAARLLYLHSGWMKNQGCVITRPPGQVVCHRRLFGLLRRRSRFMSLRLQRRVRRRTLLRNAKGGIYEDQRNPPAYPGGLCLGIPGDGLLRCELRLIQSFGA
jgi:alkylation response protein AidB-like acyl-CoA dehydrogenase